MASSKLRPKGWSLPDELVEEILGRVPIESLIRFKSICKQWYSLVKDKRFIYKHLNLSQEHQQRFIRLNYDMFQIMNPVTLDLLSLPVLDEFLYPQAYSPFHIIHCDGLLLCVVTDRTRTGCVKFEIRNPVLSQIKWVQPSSSYHLSEIYGFGYDKNDIYKILRIFYDHRSGSVFEIYDFKSKLWRAFAATFDWWASRLSQNVSMNGNMYWVADNFVTANSDMFIQSFDFSMEIFKPICSSLPFEVPFDIVCFIYLDIVALSIDFLYYINPPMLEEAATLGRSRSMCGSQAR